MICSKLSSFVRTLVCSLDKLLASAAPLCASRSSCLRTGGCTSATTCEATSCSTTSRTQRIPSLRLACLLAALHARAASMRYVSLCLHASRAAWGLSCMHANTQCAALCYVWHRRHAALQAYMAAQLADAVVQVSGGLPEDTPELPEVPTVKGRHLYGGPQMLQLRHASA